MVPVTFALDKRQSLKVAHASVFGADVRLALLRRGDPADRTLGETIYRGEDPKKRQGRDDPVSARLLIAVADDETARRAAAQAREAEMDVVDIVAELDEIHRALRRLDVDVVLLHDALGGTPVLDLARDLASAYPEVGLILLAAEDSPGLLRAAMQAGLRDVVALPLALESFEASVRSAAQWSRTMRDRVAGEESAGGALGGQLVAVAGSKGGVGTTTVALHLGLAAARLAPGPPGLPGRLRPPEGRLPRAAGHAAPAQRRRPRRRLQRDLRPPPAGDPLHAQGRASGCCSRPRRARRPRTSTPPSPATCSRRSRRATR